MIEAVAECVSVCAPENKANTETSTTCYYIQTAINCFQFMLQKPKRVLNDHLH